MTHLNHLGPPITTPARSESATSDDELLTIAEVAAIVRAPVATLRYWRHLGSGPRSFRVGRGVRYWRTDVIAWLHQQGQQQGPTIPTGVRGASSGR